ncbi:MAG: chemotaxis protein CheD [Bacteroidales bacterium]|nr:chemotaxis protein CheD [Bacteroidales bacterium]
MNQEEYSKYYLYPGSLFVDKNPHYITTLLGSCVAVCLYDTRQQYGGMNHYLLPMWNGKGLASPKYGNIAIQQLVDRMYRMGSRKQDLIAKVFGGAAVLESQNNVFFIGDRNIRIADVILEQEMQIKIAAASTGGNQGRKIVFDTLTGEVRQKYLGNSKT